VGRMGASREMPRRGTRLERCPSGCQAAA
jgi:hypothetical protein